MRMFRKSTPSRIKQTEFRQQLLQLVLPITLQQFMLALVSATDAIMLGWIDQESLSAVSLASQISFVENLFLMAMTIGQSILIAQYYGKGDMDTVGKVFGYTLKITLCISTCFLLASLLFPKGLMRIFTNNQNLIALGADYLRAVALSFLLTGISQIFLCILKNIGKARRVSLISSTSVIINIVLNGILIFGLLGLPQLKIVGAAIATAVAKMIEVIWCVIETHRGMEINIKQTLSDKVNPRIRKQFWKYTSPVLGNEIVWGVGFTMYSVIMGHLGSDAVAANSLANIIKNLVACFCNGLGAGAGILVGNELGAGMLEKAKEYGRKLCHVAIVSGGITGGVILLFIPLIIHFTNLSPQATEYLKWMLVMCSYYMIGKSINGTTIAGIFCAGGESKFGFRCDTVTMWCVTVPLGFIAAFFWKVPVLVVYFIINLDEMIKLPAVYRNYKKYHWVKDLTEE